jgi:predicted P-loop ATPase
MRNVRRTNESMAEYEFMTEAQKGQVKDGPSFVGGFIRGGRRVRGSIESRCLFTLDVDHANDGFIDMAQLMILNGMAHVIYSTHSHRPEKPKYRIVGPASRDMSPDEYSAASRMLAFIVGMEYFDKTTFDVNRLMYLPSCSRDANPVFIEGKGRLIDVDHLLGMYADWKDMTQWHRHPAENGDSVKAHGKKLNDARDKTGIVGLFNRVYSLEEAMEKFIPGVYVSVPGYDDRWTYAAGTSTGGMRTYSDGHMYSEHQSDPANDGRCHNAYDLVRIHMFGHMDVDVSKHTNELKYPSQSAMRDIAAADPLVRKLGIDETFGDWQEDTEDNSENDDGQSWMMQLEADRKDPTKILPTSKNVNIIMKNGPFKGVLAYDEFLNAEVIRKPLPWRELKRPNEEYEHWLGSDDARLQNYFGMVYRINSKAVIMNAFTEVVHQNEFNPIKNYLLAQVWDGIPRLDLLFVHYLGADDNPYVRAATRKILVAAICRVFNPGCQFDYMLVLVGPQGVGKSTILHKMGMRWFSDSLKNFDSKEAGEHLQSGWIFEFGELAQMKKAEVDEIKAFITKRSDKYRVAYDRIVSDFPRKCVFFGTTNNYNFLKDDTGNRRFWPVDVDPQKSTKSVFEDMNDYEIGQIWAEALHYHRQGESLKLPPEIEEMAKGIQEMHMEEDPRVGMIAEYLDKPLPERWDRLDAWERINYLRQPTGNIRRNLVCASEVWSECLGKKAGDMKPWEARELCNILRKMPGWKELRGRRHFSFYGKQTAFER